MVATAPEATTTSSPGVPLTGPPVASMVAGIPWQVAAAYAGAVVGTFNVMRDLACVEIGDGAMIGQWNWISAAARPHMTGARRLASRR